MIKNKNDILDFIKSNPIATKKDTAEMFGVSVVTVARLRKKIQDEQPVQLLDKTRVLVKPQLGENLTKLNIQPRNDIAEVDDENLQKPNIQKPVQVQKETRGLTASHTPVKTAENLTKHYRQPRNDIQEGEDQNLRKHEIIENPECYTLSQNVTEKQKTKNIRKHKSQPAEYECIRKCYWRERLYYKGEVYLLDSPDIPKHFELYDPNYPVTEQTLDAILGSVGHSRKTQLNI